ncbi:hypothetical protein [Megasphaera massiliensis]|uniref:hypothetical protein n=1 Tax=Megasphaera massiliensis TaxID=1232428 RepID=UPI001E2F5486|nr:hypothetical protein [Megasphaera massiliensis]
MEFLAANARFAALNISFNRPIKNTAKGVRLKPIRLLTRHSLGSIAEKIGQKLTTGNGKIIKEKIVTA